MSKRGRPPKSGKKITGKKISGKKIIEKKIIEKEITGKRRGRPPKVEITGKDISEKKIPDNIKKELYYITQEDMEIRREKIRATIPKYNPDRTPTIYNLVKDSDMCREYTKFSCHRPDIYLDLGCSECALQSNCACPLKNLNRKPEDRRPKFRRFTTKAKDNS
jgi:hypothetical protein